MTPPDVAFCYLTTRGRRSGRPHTIEIWYALRDGRLYMLSGGRDRADWVRNVAAEPRVVVRIVVAKYRHEEDLEEWGRTSLAVAVDIGEPSPSGAPPWLQQES